MARVTGTVMGTAGPIPRAYVQLRDATDDFVAEVRTDDAGRFVLYPAKGRWRVVSWAPGTERVVRDVEVAGTPAEELNLEVRLGA
jgi:hypothetical protein